MAPVFVVASEADMCETLQEVLEGEGYSVTAAAAGQAALANLRGSDTPLVVVSVEERVPVLTGIQVLETYLASALTSRRESIPLTASPNAVPTALHGRVLVVAEPFNLEELLEAVAQAVARLESK